MQLLLAGTGTPVPLVSRSGTSIHLANDADQFLIDCGPGSVHRLIQNGVNPANIDKILFTHHHMDHNADFFQFAISSWIMGRDSLTVFGPDGTESLCEGLTSGFELDLRARRTVHERPLDGLDDILCSAVSPAETIDLPEWTISVMEVDHVEGLPTVAYCVEETNTGRTVAFSADTTPMDDMVEFATEADVLIHEATLAPYAGTVPDEEFHWERFAPEDSALRAHLREIHSTPEEAAEIAAGAGVETLVLTHILPYRDTEAMRDAAQEVFDGEVIVAEDGLVLDC